MNTKGTVIERVMRLLEGGDASTRGRVGRVEVAHQLNSALSTLFKQQVLETNFKIDGASTPDGALIAVYEDIAIARRDNGRCTAILPAMPMILPKGIGVFSVYPSGQPEKEYIPIPEGSLNLLSRDKVLSPLCRSTYSRNGNKVTIHDDIVGAGVTTLDMKLCVFDIDHYEDYDPLPVPDDMVDQAFMQVCSVFGIEVPIDKADNKAASPQKQDVK